MLLLSFKNWLTRIHPKDFIKSKKALKQILLCLYFTCTYNKISVLAFLFEHQHKYKIRKITHLEKTNYSDHSSFIRNYTCFIEECYAVI